MTIKLLNPSYIYKKRHRILPCARKWFYVNPVYKTKYLFAGLNAYLSANERKLADLKNIHAGQRAFIIGNGPSLQINDLDKLKNEITFAANKVYLAFESTDWRPTYYSVEDNLVFTQNYDSIKYHSKSFSMLLPFFINELAAEIETALYFNFRRSNFYPDMPEFGTGPIGGFCWGSTVIYTLIQLAVYMGIKKLYLIGVDFHFQTPKTLNLQGSLVCEGEVNHFHRDYRKAGEKWNIPNLHMQEKTFQAVKQASEKYGFSLFNATRGGKLEVFDRVNFDDIL